jgi:hypothetical protein
MDEKRIDDRWKDNKRMSEKTGGRTKRGLVRSKVEG